MVYCHFYIQKLQIRSIDCGCRCFCTPGEFCKLVAPHVGRQSDDDFNLWLFPIPFRILHLCITLAFHFTILKDMEKMAGWHRIAIIYICSGIGGNLLSAIVTPYQPEVSIGYFEATRGYVIYSPRRAAPR